MGVSMNFMKYYTSLAYKVKLCWCEGVQGFFITRDEHPRSPLIHAPVSGGFLCLMPELVQGAPCVHVFVLWPHEHRLQVFPCHRAPYVCDPAAVVARTREHNGPIDIPVDYDHQLEHATENGQPAPAAGWITELEVRADGVWGRVEWTEKGRAHVAAREYRYVSPVYYHDRNGVIQSIESVALTNIPNLTGLKALASRELPGLQSVTGESSMSFLKTLASLFGVTDAEPTEAVVEAAARRVMTEAAKADDKTPGGIAKAVQAVAVRAEHPDVSKYVPVETFNVVNAELSQMKAAQSLALVEQGKAEGKISPALEGWAKEAAASDPEAFKKFLAAAPDLRPGGKAAQSVKATPPGNGSGDNLDDTEKSLCRAMGISEEAYKKAVQSAKGDDDGGSDE